MKRDIGPCAVGIDRNQRRRARVRRGDIGPCAVGIDRNVDEELIAAVGDIGPCAVGIDRNPRNFGFRKDPRYRPLCGGD